jgi:hypothetical protein
LEQVKVKTFRLFFVALFFGLFASVAHADTPPGDKKEEPKGMSPEEIAAMVEENKRLKLEVENGKKKPDPKPEPKDEDLQAKAKREKDDAEKTAASTKAVEKAITFNLAIDDFVSKNASLLPAEIGSIVKLAHKETYDSAVAKASALKANMIQSFFAVQANMDALTPSQRGTLDDYLKLTKNGKETKAADIYENIFEPAIDTIRKVKKAEEVGRARMGFADSDGNQAYKERLIAASRKTHLGEKGT